MQNIYSVIMAGGIGSRFWPVSTSKLPKQFHDILGTGETLIQQTFRRLSNPVRGSGPAYPLQPPQQAGLLGDLRTPPFLKDQGFQHRSRHGDSCPPQLWTFPGNIWGSGSPPQAGLPCKTPSQADGLWNAHQGPWPACGPPFQDIPGPLWPCPVGCR